MLQARYSLRAPWDEKNRPRESVVAQSGKRSIPIDHAALIERSRPRVHAKSNRHIQSRRFIHWKPIPADWYLRQWTRLVSHFQGRRVSLFLSLSLFSPDFGSLHCRSKDANQRDPSSSNNLFPSRSSRNRIVIRSHTWISFSVSWALRWNRVESRPASLIPMARWLGRQRVAPGLGVVPR